MNGKKLDFWTELRFTMSSSGIFGAYCDWIKPKVYYLNVKPSLIKGKIGFITPDSEEFNFVLTIDENIEDSHALESTNIAHYSIDRGSSGFNGETCEINLIKNNNVTP